MGENNEDWGTAAVAGGIGTVVGVVLAPVVAIPVLSMAGFGAAGREQGKDTHYHCMQSINIDYHARKLKVWQQELGLPPCKEQKWAQEASLLLLKVLEQLGPFPLRQQQ